MIPKRSGIAFCLVCTNNGMHFSDKKPSDLGVSMQVSEHFITQIQQHPNSLWLNVGGLMIIHSEVKCKVRHKAWDAEVSNTQQSVL